MPVKPPYDNPYGIWEVTTEGDCEGRTTRRLGVYSGYIDEYSDASTERGQKLRKRIAKKFKFDSLEFQSLEGIVKAIGLDRDKICTYCWDGKEN